MNKKIYIFHVFSFRLSTLNSLLSISLVPAFALRAKAKFLLTNSAHILIIIKPFSLHLVLGTR